MTFQPGNKIWLGREITPEHRQKISLANKGKRRTYEQRLLISATHLGYQMPEEQKKKISEALKGISRSDEVRKKISQTKLKKTGGKTSTNQRARESKEYFEWRKSVFIRDNFTCCNCGVNGGYLEAHHIKSFAGFPELRFDINNGQTLCKVCHRLTDNYKRKCNGN